MLCKIIDVDYVVPRNGRKKNRAVLWLVARTETGQRLEIQLPDFEPYFYIRRDVPVPEEFEDRVVRREPVDLHPYDDDSVELDRVVMRLPKDVGEVRHFLRKQVQPEVTYEADVLFPLRWMIDHGVKLYFEIPDNGGSVISAERLGEVLRPVSNPSISILEKYAVIDIEVLSGTEFPTAEEAVEPVIIISVYPSGGKPFCFVNGKGVEVKRDDVVVCKDEASMFQAFCRYVQREGFDLLIGYNSDAYDFPYLINRAARIFDRGENPLRKLSPLLYSPWISKEKRTGRLHPVIKLRPTLDVYTWLDIVLEESIHPKTLAHVSEMLLGESTIPLEYRSFRDLWHSDPDKVIDHSLRDVELTKRLLESQMILEFVERRRLDTGCLYRDLLYASRPVDVCYLREARSRGVVLPNKPVASELQEGVKYEGALVIEPKAGLHENLIIFDFAEQYPSIISAFNISPECKVKLSRTEKAPPDCVRVGTELAFKRSPVGIVTKIVRDSLERKHQAKREMIEAIGTPRERIMQAFYAATKVNVNAQYGVLGLKVSRLHDFDCAEAITGKGQQFLEFAAQSLRRRFGRDCVLYGDTDSVAFVIPDWDGDLDFVLSIRDWLNEKLRQFAKARYGIESPLVVDLDKIYSRILLVKKKNYAGYLVYKGKWLSEPKLEIKGMMAKKSSASALGRVVQSRVIKMLLDGDSWDEILRFLKSVGESLVRGEYDVFYWARPVVLGKEIEDYEVNSVAKVAARNSNFLFGTHFGRGSAGWVVYLKSYGDLRDPDGYPVRRIMIDQETPFDRSLMDVDWFAHWNEAVLQKVKPLLSSEQFGAVKELGRVLGYKPSSQRHLAEFIPDEHQRLLESFQSYGSLEAGRGVSD
ncbi:MAG: DNA polymerase domain-containing protein [Methanosarcinales archaeon]